MTPSATDDLRLGLYEASEVGDDATVKNILLSFPLSERFAASVSPLVLPFGGTWDGESPLQVAFRRGHAGAVSLLLSTASSCFASSAGSRGENNEKNETNERLDAALASGLLLAAESGHAHAIEALARFVETSGYDFQSVQSESEPESKSRSKTKTAVWSPLMTACAKGHVEAVRMLLSHRESLRVHVAQHGNLPLYIAAEHGHLKTVRLLLGLDEVRRLVNASHRRGRDGAPTTATWIARANGFPAVAIELESRGGYANASNASNAPVDDATLSATDHPCCCARCCCARCCCARCIIT